MPTPDAKTPRQRRQAPVLADDSVTLPGQAFTKELSARWGSDRRELPRSVGQHRGSGRSAPSAARLAGNPGAATLGRPNVLFRPYAGSAEVADETSRARRPAAWRSRGHAAGCARVLHRKLPYGPRRKPAVRGVTPRRSAGAKLGWPMAGHGSGGLCPGCVVGIRRASPAGERPLCARARPEDARRLRAGRSLLPPGLRRVSGGARQLAKHGRVRGDPRPPGIGSSRVARAAARLARQPRPQICGLESGCRAGRGASGLEGGGSDCRRRCGHRRGRVCGGLGGRGHGEWRAANPDQFSVEVERDPGHYVVRAGSRGRNQEERAVDLAAGDSKRVAMRVVVETALSARSRFSSPPGGAGAEARGTPARTRHAELVAAWIATGIGAASLVGAGVAWLVQQGALDDLTRECPQPSMCSRSQMAAVQATRDEGVSATTASRVLGVVGLVGVATGVVLFATRSSSSDGAALVISPTGVSAVGRF